MNLSPLEKQVQIIAALTEGASIRSRLIKVYEATPGNDSATRYSPGRIGDIDKQPALGNPDEDPISTSCVERFDLTNRMAIRRFTRLTNAFSKRFKNHQVAVSLHVAHYNFCRVHERLRTTPAMALSVSDHICSIGELVDAALSEPQPASAIPVPPVPTRPGSRRFQLRVIHGGTARWGAIWQSSLQVWYQGWLGDMG